MRNTPASQRAWAVAASFVLAYALVFLTIYLALSAGGSPEPYQLTWWHLRVPGLDRSFGDLRTVTHGVECLRRGIDPYVVNPCDPWWRLVNYPPVWLKGFDLLGIGPKATSWLGAGIDVAFMAAAIAFLGRRPLWQGVVYGAALISPAVMMGIERGNNDLLVFALMTAGLGLVVGRSPAQRSLGTLTLLMATVLKLFPVFSVAMVLVRRRTLLLPALVVAVTTAAYLLAVRDSLDAIARNTHREVFYSYGAEVLFIGLKKYLGLKGALAWKAPVFACVIAAALSLGFLCRTSFELRDDRFGAGFAVAGAIYLFSFSVASSFDYRLAFLLLGLPQLMDWATVRADRRQRMICILALGAILLALWLSFYSVKIRLIDELFTWTTFFLLLTMMTAAGLRFLAWLPRARLAPMPGT